MFASPERTSITMFTKCAPTRFFPELAFVPEKDGEIVGSVMYTKAWLEGETGRRNGQKKRGPLHGPLCVAPKYQRQKQGRLLIGHSSVVL